MNTSWTTEFPPRKFVQKRYRAVSEIFFCQKTRERRVFWRDLFILFEYFMRFRMFCFFRWTAKSAILTSVPFSSQSLTAREISHSKWHPPPKFVANRIFFSTYSFYLRSMLLLILGALTICAKLRKIYITRVKSRWKIHRKNILFDFFIFCFRFSEIFEKWYDEKPRASVI